MNNEYDYKLLKTVGEDVFINSQVAISRPELVEIGSHVAIDWGFYATTQIRISDYIHIAPYVTSIGGGKGSLICKGFNNIMAGARIISGSDRFDDSGLFGTMIPEEYHGRVIFAPVILESFSNIGTNAVVLPGAHLEQGVLLTVGSVLIGATEPWTVYSGNPAKPKKKIQGDKIIENAKKLGWIHGI